MKVVLNRITNFEGVTLKPGDVIDVPLNVGQRWINNGLAHEYKEQVKRVWKVEPSIIEPIKKPIKKSKK